MSLRPVRQILNTKATIEGAGVKLQRAFGFGNTKEFELQFEGSHMGGMGASVCWATSEGARVDLGPTAAVSSIR